jgi:hypothetical protein
MAARASGGAPSPTHGRGTIQPSSPKHAAPETSSPPLHGAAGPASSRSNASSATGRVATAGPPSARGPQAPSPKASERPPALPAHPSATGPPSARSAGAANRAPDGVSSAGLGVQELQRLLLEGAEFLKFGKHGKPHYKRVICTRGGRLLWLSATSTETADELSRREAKGHKFADASLMCAARARAAGCV